MFKVRGLGKYGLQSCSTLNVEFSELSVFWLNIPIFYRVHTDLLSSAIFYRIYRAHSYLFYSPITEYLNKIKPDMK